MNERTNERMNEWMNEWMNKWTNEWLNEWTNERTNEWINEWMNERTNEWMKIEGRKEWGYSEQSKEKNKSISYKVMRLIMKEVRLKYIVLHCTV